MPLTGVAGWPVAHSRSPALHAAAFADIGLEGWESQLLPIPPDLFTETVLALPQSGFAGINVTIPHKEAALSLADTASEACLAIGAANTLTFNRDGSISADNTDSPAIRSVVEELAPVDAAELSALVLGAGGSARAALHGLGQSGMGRVAVWNRNPDRAASVASDFPDVAVADAVDGFDVIVNATPVGLVAGSALSEIGLGSGLPDGVRAVVDLVYSTGGTELQALARAGGVALVDGLEILVRQGALSVELWTGKRPELEPLRKAVSDRQ
jgi:shikimate dehydrogenase